MVLLCCAFLRGLNANTAAPTKRVKVVKIGCAQSAKSNRQAFSAIAHNLRSIAPVSGQTHTAMLLGFAQLEHVLGVYTCIYAVATAN